MLSICLSYCTSPGIKHADDDNADDSLARSAPDTESFTKTDTLRDTVYLPEPREELAKLRVGRHKLTLQWISWDEPGYVDISEPIEGWYAIKGEQIGKTEGEYLRIDGKLKPVSETELLFRGTIESKVSAGNNGEPCVRNGSKVFLTKDNRKYWRLQDMLNCDKIITDYIDIYF